MKHLGRMRRLARLVLCLEMQDGAELHEGGVGSKHRYEGDLLLELFPEADEESVDEGPIVNVITELTEFVADRLDALTENAHGAIALRDRAKLGVEGGDASIPVVLEEPAELGPNITRGGTIRHHKVEELGGDACVQPLDKSKIIEHLGLCGAGCASPDMW